MGTGKFKEDTDKETFEKVANKKTSPSELAIRPEDKQELWLKEAGITNRDDFEAIVYGFKQLQGISYHSLSPAILPISQHKMHVTYTPHYTHIIHS